MAEQKKSSTKS
jgi:hypothetical protein